MACGKEMRYNSDHSVAPRCHLRLGSRLIKTPLQSGSAPNSSTEDVSPSKQTTSPATPASVAVMLFLWGGFLDSRLIFCNGHVVCDFSLFFDLKSAQCSFFALCRKKGAKSHPSHKLLILICFDLEVFLA